MTNDRFEEKSVSPFEIGFNPVQEDLDPIRIKDKDMEDLEKQFLAYKEDTGKYFNDLFKIGVRPASEAERKELKVNYIAIDGNRRTAIARKLKLSEVPIIIDRSATPEDDVINLKRVVEGDKGYTPVFAARLVERMINEGFSKERIEAEYKGETLNRMLAFIAAPKSLQAVVKEDPTQFTKIAKIAQTVLTKDTSGLRYIPYKGMKPKNAEAIMNMVYSKSDYNRKGLNSEELRKVAMQYRDNLLEGNLIISTDGESFEAKFPWSEVGIDYGSLTNPEEIWNACSTAIDKLKTKGYEAINSGVHFNEALKFLMEKLDIDAETIADALGKTLPYVHHLLNRESHPSSENQGDLIVELPRHGVPRNVVLQVWLLALRDKEGGTNTKREAIANKFEFKASKLLREFLNDHNLTQADMVAYFDGRISQATISNILGSKAMPTAEQQSNIVGFLKNRGAKAIYAERWQDAVARDKVYYWMISDKEAVSQKRRERIIKIIDENLEL